MSNEWLGKLVPGCGFCEHSNYELMKCFPNSPDCKKEYDLVEEDFHKKCHCDFFKHKKK